MCQISGTDRREMFLGMPIFRLLLIIMLVVGSVAPVMGMVFLFYKDQSKTTVSLMIANMASLLMNGCYALALWADGMNASRMAMKMQYAGNAFFIVFFILFLSHYIRVNYLRVVFPIWTFCEACSLFIVMIDDPRRLVFENEEIAHIDKVNMDILTIDNGPVTRIRYVLIIILLLACLVTTTLRYFGSTIRKERINYLRIAVAEVIIFIAAIIKVSVRFRIDIMPICMSVAIFVIDYGLIKGGLLRVTDMGRQWIFENGKTVYIIVDSVYRYLDSNEAAKEMFPSLRHHKLEKVLPDEIRHMLFDSSDEDIEIEGRKYNRQVIKMNQDHTVMGYTILLNDVTERLLLMEELREEKERADEANRVKSNFVSTISHEIRTPMNAIVGITDILLRKQRDKEDTDYLMNIKSSGDALLLIINDILDYSKIEAGQMKVVDDEYVPAVMLNDMHMIFVTRIGSKPVELRYEIMDDLPGKLFGDALRIRQIIINFMNNAIKFTDSGSVTLRVRALEENEDIITLEFSVIDTGLGIKEEDIKKLFSSFSQVDEKRNHSKEGTGLGLAICKQLAELMGGYVGVESTYGEGSRFYAVIPQKIIDRKPAENIERTVTTEFEFECPEVKLLLVDDNEMNLKVAKGLLEPLHMDIDTAMNGKQAIDMLGSKKYDLVFMDHMMPIMDGVEAAKRIRSFEDEYFKTLPVVALSANVTEEAQEEFDECGMNAFVAKPIKMKEVCEVLERLMPKEKIVRGAARTLTDNDKKNAGGFENGSSGIGVSENERAFENGRTSENERASENGRTSENERAYENGRTPENERASENGRTPENERASENGRTPENERAYENGRIPENERTSENGRTSENERAYEYERLLNELKGTYGNEDVSTPIHVNEGIESCGTKELYISLLGDFYKYIDIKANKIEKCLADHMLRDYTIEVHALKNTARMIGALELSEEFKHLEELGNKEEEKTIVALTPGVLERLRGYKEVLEPFSTSSNEEKEEVSNEDIIAQLSAIKDAMDTFDLDGADAALKKLLEYKLPENIVLKVNELDALVADVAIEDTMALCDEIIYLVNA